MKFTTPLMTVAAVFAFVASHQAHAGPASTAQEAALNGANSHTVLLAQADRMSPREYRASESSFAGPGKRGARVAAQKGPEALRRYVDRTRMIYALEYQEFAKP